MEIHIIQGIPTKIGNHRIETIDDTYLSERGIVIVTDQRNLMNVLYHAKEFDIPGHPPTFLVYLSEEEWSSIVTLDMPGIEEEESVVDLSGIIRIHIGNGWYGLQTFEDGRMPEMFKIAPELSDEQIIMYVHPFVDGYARIVTRQRGEQPRGMGIGYTLCRTDGTLVRDHTFSFVLPQILSSPGEALAMGHNWVEAGIRISDGNIQGTAEFPKEIHARRLKNLENMMRRELEAIHDWLFCTSNPEWGTDEWIAMSGFEYSPTSMLPRAKLHPTPEDVIASHF